MFLNLKKIKKIEIIIIIIAPEDRSKASQGRLTNGHMISKIPLKTKNKNDTPIKDQRIRELEEKLRKMTEENLKLKEANQKLRKICKFFATDNLELLNNKF